MGPAFLATAALAAALLAPVARADVIYPTHWDISVDDANRILTVNVRLTFFLRPCPASGSCAPPQAWVDSIVGSINRLWNTTPPKTFRCYRVIFRITARTASSQEAAVAQDDALAVGLDSTRLDFRDHVVGTTRNDDHLSNSPADAVVPVNDPDSPSTWAGRPDMQSGGVYAHEFGHVLGLHDNYVEGTWEIRPGAQGDLMYSGIGSFAKVSQEMMDRMMQRMGVRPEELHCDIQIDTTITTGAAVSTFTGVKCDPPTGEWKIDWKAKYPQMSWDGVVTVNLRSNLKGPYKASLTWEVEGIAPGGDRMSGQARFDPGTATGAQPRLVLGPISGSAWIHGVSGDIQSSQDTVLTGKYGEFCLE